MMIILLLLMLLFGGCGFFSAASVSTAPPVVIEVTPAPAIGVTAIAVCQVTPADQLGPYYIEGAPERDTLYPAGTAGTPLLISGTVYGTGCQPLAGALVEVWQADSNGEYDFSADFLGRAAVIANENGHYEFTTVMPGRYEPRPLHIHFRVSHPDVPTLVTQLYFAGDAQGIPAAQVTTPIEEDGVLHGTFDIMISG